MVLQSYNHYQSCVLVQTMISNCQLAISIQLVPSRMVIETLTNSTTSTGTKHLAVCNGHAGFQLYNGFGPLSNGMWQNFFRSLEIPLEIIVFTSFYNLGLGGGKSWWGFWLSNFDVVAAVLFLALWQQKHPHKKVLEEVFCTETMCSSLLVF